MVFDIDLTSSMPIYAQIVTQVKHAIAGGVLRQGDPLPSLREMASHLRINPLTVTRAYRELEAKGIAVTEHGRGTFISADTNSLSDGYRQEAVDQAVDAMLVEVRRLGATPDDIRTTVETRLRLLMRGQADADTEADVKLDGQEEMKPDE